MGHIKITGVRYELPDGRALLDDISFRVSEVTKAALIGANGTGRHPCCGSSPVISRRTPAPLTRSAGSE